MTVLVVSLAPLAAGSANAQAVPSPSPSLGAGSPAPDPPGATNASPRDYRGAVWIVLGVVGVIVVVAGGTLLLTRTRRFDLRQLSTPEDKRREAAERDGDDPTTHHRR
jgi:hypothetical protein